MYLLDLMSKRASNTVHVAGATDLRLNSMKDGQKTDGQE